MKTFNQHEQAPALRRVGLIMATAVVAGVGAVVCLAQDAKAPAAADSPGTPVAIAVNASASAAEPARTALVRHSPSIDAILQMVDGGVSTNIVKSYVESSLVPFDPTPADLLALKQHGVSDEITLAIIQHGAQLRQQFQQTPAAAPATTPGPVNPRTAGFDPEGYDFWWYHYAYPRTLASIDQRMAGFTSPYAYWDYHPFALRPSFALAYSYPPTLSFGFHGGGPTPHAWREPRGNRPNPDNRANPIQTAPRGTPYRR